MASASSFAVTLGNGTRFTMPSRPDTEIAAAVFVMPAFCTHSRMASLTRPGSLMLPSLITSRGRGTWAKALRA